jgi:cellobiose dehydrogenase (acceptor)
LNDGPEDHSKTKVFGHPVYSYEDGQRSGPVRTYLQCALQRENFSFITGARILRVIRDGDTATGVEVQHDNMNDNGASKYHIREGGLIVSSAGALLSTQLLMWSGIGPEEILANISQMGLVKIPPQD